MPCPAKAAPRSGMRRIGGRSERTNLEIVHAICSLLDDLAPATERGRAPHRDLITFVTDRPGHDRRYAIDSTKTRKVLGWEPLQRFEDALAETVDWYVEHRAWWERIISGEYLRYYERQYGLREGQTK